MVVQVGRKAELRIYIAKTKCGGGGGGGGVCRRGQRRQNAGGGVTKTIIEGGMPERAKTKWGGGGGGSAENYIFFRGGAGSNIKWNSPIKIQPMKFIVTNVNKYSDTIQMNDHYRI